MTLAEVFAAAAAAELEDVDIVTRDEATEWRRGGRAFAVLTGTIAEFRLDRVVAGAALRTPDTRSSSRGPEWVAFEPTDLDGHARDRAEAWFGAAWRRAATGPS